MSVFSISNGDIKSRPPDRFKLTSLVTCILLAACVTVAMVTKYNQLTSAIPSIIAVPLQRSWVAETNDNPVQVDQSMDQNNLTAKETQQDWETPEQHANITKRDTKWSSSSFPEDILVEEALSPVRGDTLRKADTLQMQTPLQKGAGEEKWEAWLARMEEVHAARRATVRRACERHNIKGPIPPPRRLHKLRYNDPYRTVFCDVAKSGSTTMKNILAQVDPNYKYIQKFGVYDPKAFKDLSRYGRAVDLFEALYGDHFVKGRTTSEKARLETGGRLNVTFPEFVRGVLTRRREYKNVHWAPQHGICHPCVIHYDYIGHLDTMSDDVKFIMHKTGILGKVAAPTQSARRAGDNMAEMYAEIPHEDIIKLGEVFSFDYEAYGFSFEDTLRKLKTQ